MLNFSRDITTLIQKKSYYWPGFEAAVIIQPEQFSPPMMLVGRRGEMHQNVIARYLKETTGEEPSSREVDSLYDHGWRGVYNPQTGHLVHFTGDLYQMYPVTMMWHDMGERWGYPIKKLTLFDPDEEDLIAKYIDRKEDPFPAFPRSEEAMPEEKTPPMVVPPGGFRTLRDLPPKGETFQDPYDYSDNYWKRKSFHEMMIEEKEWLFNA